MAEIAEINGENLESHVEDLKNLPDFAAVCSFISHFGTELGIHLTFPQLLKFLVSEPSLDTRNWEMLHVKLLNKLKYRAKPDRWEPVLARFLVNHGPQLEEIQNAVDVLSKSEVQKCAVSKSLQSYAANYFSLTPTLRAKTLLCLLETQFDRNQNFKDKINLRSPSDLRFPRLGSDVWGRNYWLLKDTEINIHLYREDLEENTFVLICDSFEGIRNFLGELRNEFPEDAKLTEILPKKKSASNKPFGSDNNLVVKNPFLNLLKQGVTSSDEYYSINKCQSLKEEDEILNTDNGNVKPSSPKCEKSLDKKDIASSNDSVNDSKDGDNNNNESVDRCLEIKKETLNTNFTNDQNLNENQIVFSENEETPKKEGVSISTSAENIEPLLSGVQTPVSSSEKLNNYIKTEEPKVDESNSHTNLRRSGRQRKPVQVFVMEPIQPRRMKVQNKQVKSDGKLKSGNENQTNSHQVIIRKGKRHFRELGEIEDKKKKKKKRRHRKKVRKGSNAWRYGTSTSESETEEDDSFEQALLAQQLPDSDDSDSFDVVKKSAKQSKEGWSDAPESDFDPDGIDHESDADSIKHGRNLARQKRLQRKLETTSPVDGEKEEPCQICLKTHMPDWILLCDQCDLGHHAMCLCPPLFVIPDGNWYCPRCQHGALIKTLEELVGVLEAEHKKHDVWKRMQERLNFVNISMTNIIADDGEELNNGVIKNSNLRKSRRSKTVQNGNARYADSDSCFSDENVSDNSSSCTQSSTNEFSGDRSNDDHKLFKNRKIHISEPKKPRRSKFIDQSYGDSSTTSESEELPTVRSTRHRQVKYKVSEAFRELDEALEADEKYQKEKKRRQKRKNRAAGLIDDGDDDSESEGDNRGPPAGRSRGKDLSNILGPDWKDFDDDKPRSKRRRIAGSLSSYSSDDHDEGEVDGKHTKSEDEDADFKPSFSEASESEFSEKSEQLNSSVSNNSWLSSARKGKARSHRRAKTRNNRSRSTYRSRKPLTRFEESDDEFDDVQIQNDRSRRCTRAVISYRESDEESSDDGDGISSKQANKNITENGPPTSISHTLKANRNRRRKRVLDSSDSEFKVDDDENEDDDEEEGDADEEEAEGDDNESERNDNDDQHRRNKYLSDDETDEGENKTLCKQNIKSEMDDKTTSSFSPSIHETSGSTAENLDTKQLVSETDVSRISLPNYPISFKGETSDIQKFENLPGYLSNSLNADEDDDEDVEDEVDECLPSRRIHSQVLGKEVNKNTSLSPDLF